MDGSGQGLEKAKAKVSTTCQSCNTMGNALKDPPN